MSGKITKLLRLLDEETAKVGGFERALYCLLKRHEEELPELDDYFHKAFRQIDVIDGYTDSAIWNLLGVSRLFWTCFERAQGETRTLVTTTNGE